jgi:hypothetical protein
MRKIFIFLSTAALLTGTAMAGPSAARDRSDRSDRTELTSSQLTDQAAARAAQLKADLRLTPEQNNNWPGFETAIVDIWKAQAERRMTWRNARAKGSDQQARANPQDNIDLIEQMRREADQQVQRGNDQKKLADAAEPLYATLNDQQKRQLAQALFRSDRDRRGD